MKSSLNLFVTLLWLASIIFSTTAQTNLTSLAKEKIDDIRLHSEAIFNIIQTTNNDNIYAIGKFIVNLTRDNSQIQNLEDLQPEIINKTECLWQSGQSRNYFRLFRGILTKSNEHYSEFEDIFSNNKINIELHTQFIKYADLTIQSYIRDQVLHSYVKLANRTIPTRRNGLFDVLADNYNSENNCNVQFVNELFADMAALYSLVFTKRYTIILMSMKAMQVPDCQNEMYSVAIYNDLMDINPIIHFQDLLTEARKYYEEAIDVAYSSVIKAFIK